MPISDEIIELEPVKKNKPKLIILIAIAGVMLALAVTFLVLWIVKPNVEPITENVVGVTVETSSLHGKPSGEGAERYDGTASVGNEYEITAFVSTEGKAEDEDKYTLNRQINWEVSPVNALVEISRVFDENEKNIYRFKPNADFAGQVVTVTARSWSDADFKQEVKIKIVNQGTEELKLLQFWREGATTAGRSDIKNNTIEVPYYSTNTNNVPFIVTFDQFGAWDESTGEYSKLTDVDDSTKVEVTSGDTAKVSIGNVSVSTVNGATPRFYFTPRGLGDTEITIKANAFNDYHDEVVVKLKVSVVSNKEKNYIDGIFVLDKPVDLNFFKTRSKLAESDWFKGDDYTRLTFDTRNDGALVLPYNGTYSEILSHLVISPLSVQYDEAGDKLRAVSDWMSRIKVEASNNTILQVSRNGNEKPQLTGKKLCSPDECTLTFTDQSPSSIGASQKVKVNIIANNNENGGKVYIGNANTTTYNDAWLTNPNNKYETAPNVPITLKVEYTFFGPTDVDIDTMVSSGYVSTGFMIDVPDGATITVGETTIRSGTRYDFTKSLKITKPVAASGNYIGTADVNIMFNEDAEEGAHTLVFRKLGTYLEGAGDRLNSLDADWSKTIRFNVSKIATKAEFKDKDDIINIVSDGGAYAADFRLAEGYPKQEGNIWRSNANLYLQHREQGEEIGFDFEDLIKKHGTSTTRKEITNNNSNYGFVQTNEFASLKYNDKIGTETQRALLITMREFNTANTQIAELVINVYVISAITTIEPTAKDGLTEVSYSADDYGSTVLGDNLSFVKAYGNADTSRKPLSDVDITLSKSGIILSHNWAEGDISYKYGDDTIFTYNTLSGNIKPAIDLFAYGYENNIALGEIKVTYYVEERSWQKAVECDSLFTFKRKADDAYVYANELESYLPQHKLTADERNTYTCFVNLGQSMGIYISSVVKYDWQVGGETVSREIIVSNTGAHTGHAVSSVERAYIMVSEELTFIAGGNKVSTDPSSKAYYNLTFTAPTTVSDSGSDDYTGGLVVGPQSRQLKVTVQNLSRPISDIKIYNAVKGESTSSGAPTYTCGNTELDESNYRFLFGNLNKADPDGMPYVETFYIEITYSALSAGDEFTRFEPIKLQLPYYVSYRLGLTGEYEQGDIEWLEPDSDYGVWTVEISKPAVKEDLENTSEVTYRVQCFLQAIAESAHNVEADRVADDHRMVVYPSYHDTENSRRIRIPISVLTGLSDIQYSVDSRGPYSANTNGTTPVECTMTVTSFGQEDAPILDLLFNYIGLSAGDGYHALWYDERYISFENVGDSSFGIFEAEISEFGLSITLDIEALKTMTASQLAEYVSGKVLTFSLCDTAGGAEKYFTISVKIKLEAKINELEIDGAEFDIVTNGKTDGSKAESGEISVILNNDKANALITTEERGRVSFEICEVASDGTVTTYTGSDISISGNKVLVKNDFLTTEQKYYVRAKYVGNIYDEFEEEMVPFKFYSEPVKLVITTNAAKIELADGGLSVTTVNGIKTATVNVAGPSEEFLLGAIVKNNGTNAVINGAAVTYKLYSDSNAQTELESTIATITGGKIKFAAGLTSASGEFFYRASYRDAARGTDIYTDIVKIKYTVVLSGVELTAAPSGNAYTMYYYSNGANTNFTVLKFAASDFSPICGFSGIAATGVTYKLTNNSDDLLGINNGSFTVSPKAAGTGATFTLTATFNGVTVEGDTYTVNITEVDVLSLTATSGTLNVFKAADEEGGHISFGPVANAYADFDVTYSVTGDAKINKTADANGNVTLTLDRSRFGAAADYKSYTVTLTASYAIKSGSKLTLANPIVTSASYTVTVDGTFTYAPAFDFTANGTAISGSHDIVKTAAAGYYKVELTGIPTQSWYVDSHWTYSARSTSSPIDNIAAFDSSKKANVTLKAGASGETKITVTATAYGKSFTKEQTYTLVDSGAASASLTTSYKTASNVNVSSGNSYPSDFTDASDARTFIYTINANGLGVADVTTSDITVDYSGCVSVVEAIDEPSASIFTIKFRADKAFGASGTFSVTSYVTVNGKVYYPSNKDYTVTLTATAPVHTLGVDSNRILPNETATFSLSNANGATVDYAIISGSTYASIDATGVLTPNNSVGTTDKSVVVRATVAISGGAFDGATYSYEKAVVIAGVPLPEIEWNSDIDTDIVLDGASTLIDLKQYVLKSVTATGKTENTFDYAGATYRYTVSHTVTSADFSVDNNGGTLTVNRNNRTLAGGKFTVYVTATMPDGINGGAEVRSETITFRIVPQAKAVSGVTVTGEVGKSFDIFGAVTLYTGTLDGQIKAGDDYTVSYALASPSDDITVSGRYLTFNNFSTVQTVELVATVVINGGAYAGTVMTVNTSVTVNAFDAGKTQIAWVSNDEVNSYSTLDVAQLLAGKTASTISGISVTALDYGAFVNVEGNGTSAPVVSFDNDINVSNEASASAKDVTLEFRVKCADNSEYYGRGVVAVSAVKPQLNVFIDGMIFAAAEGSSIISHNVEGGSSFGLEMRETHGLPIESIDFDENQYLRAVKSGAYMVITVADVDDDSTTTVTLTARIGDLTVSQDLELDIAKRQSIAAYTAAYKHTGNCVYQTNNTLMLAQSGARTEIEFKLTATSDYRYPYSLTLSGNSLTNKIYSISARINGTPYSGDVRSSSATINFYTQSGSWMNQTTTMPQADEITVTIWFYTSSTLSNSNINMSLVSYNNSNRSNGSYTTTALTYTVGVGAATVTLKNMDGTPDGSVPIQSGHAPTIDDPNARAGYTFAGWYCSNVGGVLSEPYTPHIEYYSFTLYAKWNPAQISVELDKNASDATAGTTSVRVTYNAAYSELGTVTEPTRTGYNFAGWYTDAEGGTRVNVNTVVSNTSAHTLYAHWTAHTWTVTFNPNNGEATYTKTVTYGQPYGAMPTPAKTGYTFDGWYLSGAPVGATVTTDGDHTLVAHWTAASITVTLNAMGGTGAPASVTRDFDGTYGNLGTPTKAGYTFAGWYTQPDGGTDVRSSTAVDVAANHTLYAHWTANTYNVTLNYGYAGAADGSITVTYGATFGDATGFVAQPTRTGYTFIGWYDGNNKMIAEGTLVGELASGYTITARWIANAPTLYTVTFKDEDGETIATQIVIDGGNAMRPQDPTKDGYSFIGWFEDDASDAYDFSAVVTGDVTLTARFAEIVTD